MALSKNLNVFLQFTLVEMLVVLMVLIALATIAVPISGQLALSARDRSTAVSMLAVREAIMGSDGQPGYYHDAGGRYPMPGAAEGRHAHPQLRYLFVQAEGLDLYAPSTGLGWRGPYLQATSGRYEVEGAFTDSFGVSDDPAPLDGWGHPIVLQLFYNGSAVDGESEQYARLVSAGPNGTLETPASIKVLSAADVGDDRVLYLQVAGSVNLGDALNFQRKASP